MMNASFNRCQLVNEKKLRVRMMPPQHLGQFYEVAEKMDKPLEVAIVIGSYPGSTSRLTWATSPRASSHSISSLKSFI